MSLLLYGIVFAGSRHGSQPPPRLPSGVGGAPVRLIQATGLGAAVSTVASSALTPTVERALAYARVVEALHADRTVLPLRYGCALSKESDVVDLLGMQGGTYAELLRGLDGCVEMGVRILTAARPSAGSGRPELVEGRGSAGKGDPSVTSAEWRAEAWGSLPGTAYLNRRTELYAEQERCAREVMTSAQRLRAAFAGLFLTCKMDGSPAVGPRTIFRVPLLSLYFLVKREVLPSFRVAFLRIDLAERARLLLSGPWPPYNFAVRDLRNE